MTILATHVYGISPTILGMNKMWFALILFAVAAILMVVAYKMFDYTDKSGYVVGIATIFFIAALIIGIASPRYTEVKALVDPDVSFTEITQSYELTGRDGEMYTFRVKEP